MIVRKIYYIYSCTFLVTILFSCSIKYFKYQKTYKKVINGEISKEEFDEKFYIIYNQRSNFSPTDSLIPIKFQGSYVRIDKFGTYETYKFYPNGVILKVSNLTTYPTVVSLKREQYEHRYYLLKDNNIQIEYLLSRDWNLYNIFINGQIKGDSLNLTEIRNNQIPWDKNKINEIYLYDEKIIFLPN